MVSSAFTPAPGRDATAQVSALRSPSRWIKECLAGVTTSLALVPEVISFAVVAGVSPKVSLMASVVLGLVLSLLGGRPAMVTAAAGSVALVIGPTVKAHGAQYVLPIVLLAGLIQVGFGLFRLSALMRYVPRSVLTGFVNALGILIFAAQVPHVWDQSAAVYALLVLTVGIVLLVPRFTKAVPSPLVAVVIVTLLATTLGLELPHVGGESGMASGLPGFTQWLVPFKLQTLEIVWPAALSVAFVGLLESLLTAKLVDELTQTGSSKSRESWALGLGNLCAGWYGGIGGCAMIGQTVVNVELGGARTRVSTAVAALVLLLLATCFAPVLSRIPMVALAAIMMVVAVKTVSWRSLRLQTLRRVPLAETGVMAITVAITVWTSNLALGVGAGVFYALILFARRVAHGIRAERTLHGEGQAARYDLHGAVFFASSGDLLERFAYGSDPKVVSIDFTHAPLWDACAVAALDSIKKRYVGLGTLVTFTGLDRRSSELYARLSGHLDEIG